jgi:hypothetical protein
VVVVLVCLLFAGLGILARRIMKQELKQEGKQSIEGEFWKKKINNSFSGFAAHPPEAM